MHLRRSQLQLIPELQKSVVRMVGHRWPQAGEAMLLFLGIRLPLMRPLLRLRSLVDLEDHLARLAPMVLTDRERGCGKRKPRLRQSSGMTEP